MPNPFEAAIRAVVDFQNSVRDRSVVPTLDVETIRAQLNSRFDFQAPVADDTLLQTVTELLSAGIVHITHPRYFGLFNPSVTAPSIVGDVLVAGFNPQLAAYSHAPAAIEIEQHVLRFFARKLGLDAATMAASFTTGGLEANLSAALAALAHAYPDAVEKGLAATGARPVIYVSSQTHDSMRRIAQNTGLGRNAIRPVDVTPNLRMDIGALEHSIREDRARGLAPFMIVGTAGTTAAGVIDPLEDLARVAKREDLWFHVDAAWGGAAVLSSKLRPHLKGIERADSITWDAHKWLSVPMGAGMFFCRHRGAALSAFGFGSTAYMPAKTAGALDPYTSSLQWSRRFIGLKVFMSMAALGESGLEQMINRMSDLGDGLRARLEHAGFAIVNQTPLPLVCFTHPRMEAAGLTAGAVADRVQNAGRVWISAVTLPGIGGALRACITSFKTEERDLDELVREVTRAMG